MAAGGDASGLLLGLGVSSGVALALFWGAEGGPPPTLPPAPPTENRLADGAEEANKAARKAWFEQRHAAPPGVDWRVVERANGLQQIRKRNALVAARGAAPAPEEGPWTERGSNNQAGRAHVAVPSSDGSDLYMGSSLGGVWRGDPDGGDWTPLGDNLYGGAHWLVVLSPAEADGPDVMLAATDGGLVHRSVDDGATWLEPEGLGSLSGVRRLLMSSDGSETVFLLGYSGRYRLYRSTDGAASFEEIVDLGSYAGDLWAPRDGGSELYLADAGSLWQSEDLGDSWVELGSYGSSSRAELTASEAGAPRFWVAKDGGTLVHSDDLGQTWEGARPLSDYWGALNASMVDPDLFAWGGVELWVTRDGGESFAEVNDWADYYGDPRNKLHADMMGVDVYPVEGGTGEVWFVNTDGGLYESRDSLDSVENLSLEGLRISQYYSTLTSVSDPDYLVAGAQDQGWQATFGPQDSQILDFDQLWSGDYGHITSSDGTLELAYAVYPGFTLMHIGQESPALSYAYFPEGTRAWLPPVVADPDDPEVFYLVGQELLRYERTSEWIWEPTQHSEEVFGSGDWTYLSALAFSPVDSDRVYGAQSDGTLYVSDDHGVTWTESADLGPEAHYFYGTSLIASSTDVDTAWVGGSGYGASKAVYRTTDGGRTWEAFDEGLGDTLVYGLGEVPDGSGRLVAGTQNTVFRRDPGMEEWVDVTADTAPTTVYWSVEALPGSKVMRFGTYGRGIWDYAPDLDSSYPWPETEDTGGGDEGGTDGGGDDGGSEGGGGSGSVDPVEPGGCGACSQAGAGGAGSRQAGLLSLLLVGLGALRRRRA